MDIKATKIELLRIIIETENAEFIQRILDYVKKEEKDFWNKLSLSEQKEIKKGINELNNGKKVSFDAFLKKIS